MDGERVLSSDQVMGPLECRKAITVRRDMPLGGKSPRVVGFWSPGAD
jgi:hypothetical protein